MSVRSWPRVHPSESVVHQTTRSEAGQGYVESTREDVNPVVPELRIHGEGTVNEKINSLFKTRIELMNTLTTTQEWIQENIYAGTTLEEIMTRKIKGYDECWREFVNVHEQYIELLVHEKEKENACRSYKEQMTRKMHLDEMIASFWRRLKLEARERGEVSSSSGKTSRSSASKSMSRSSKLSTVSRKKEKLALAQLKRSQLLKQHELERKMSELNFEKEAMEAQMEEERALVSLNVYNEEADIELEREHSNSIRATTVLQQQQVLSPFVQPYVPQEPPVDPPSIPLQPVPITHGLRKQVERFEVQTLLTRPYVPQEQPVQSPNISLQPVPVTYLPEDEVRQQPKEMDRGEEMVRALRQVISMPKMISDADFRVLYRQERRP